LRDLHLPEFDLSVDGEPRQQADRLLARLRVRERSEERARPKPQKLEQSLHTDKGSTRGGRKCGVAVSVQTPGMDMGWGEARCIVCLGTPTDGDADSAMTKGHVIPRSVGGELFADNECKRCNERFGHGPEAALVGDPAIRSAAEAIADQIPDLIQRMRRRKVFVTQSDSGLLVRAAPDSDGDDFKILQTRQPDGSRTASTDDIRSEIETTLRRRGCPEEQVAEELRRLDDAPPETPVSIGGEFVIRKGSVEGFGLPYDDPIVPDVTLLAIAYRYLAGCADGLIYDAAFDPIRDAIESSALPREGVWHVEPCWTRQPQPWHGLAIKEVQPHVVVYVRLFGDLIWLVHFEQIALKSESCVPNRIDLTDSSEHLGG
jgi:hypothetical protein